MKKQLIKMIDIYQKYPLKKGNNCVFIPSCSEYTKEAIIKYGCFKGIFLGIKRIFRCHPWQKNNFDPLK